MHSQPQPLYEQIKMHVLERIADGTFRPGERIPSENQLAAELGSSRLTAHRALRELTVSGILKRIAGVGTFVSAPQATSTFVMLHNISDEIRARGEVLSIRVNLVEKTRLSPDIAAAMNMDGLAAVFHSVLVYCANGSPVQLEDRYVSCDFAPDYIIQDFEKKSTTDYLKSIAFPTRAESEIRAIMPSSIEAASLEMETSDPCLVVSRTTWVGNDVTTFTRFIHPGPRHSFTATEALNDG